MHRQVEVTILVAVSVNAGRELVDRCEELQKRFKEEAHKLLPNSTDVVVEVSAKPEGIYG